MPCIYTIIVGLLAIIGLLDHNEVDHWLNELCKLNVKSSLTILHILKCLTWWPKKLNNLWLVTDKLLLTTRTTMCSKFVTWHKKIVWKKNFKQTFQTKTCLHFQLPAYGGLISYTVSYKTDQQDPTAIRVTSEPDLIIEVNFINQTQLKMLNTVHVPPQDLPPPGPENV